MLCDHRKQTSAGFSNSSSIEDLIERAFVITVSMDHRPSQSVFVVCRSPSILCTQMSHAKAREMGLLREVEW